LLSSPPGWINILLISLNYSGILLTEKPGGRISPGRYEHIHQVTISFFGE
jgi:hypothetical protein